MLRLVSHFRCKSRNLLALGSWQAPSAPFMKVNFDAGFLSSDSFQVAVVAHDEEGHCLGWSVRKLPGTLSPVVAEGWSHIQLEGDCMQVINAFNDRDRQ